MCVIEFFFHSLSERVKSQRNNKKLIIQKTNFGNESQKDEDPCNSPNHVSLFRLEFWILKFLIGLDSFFGELFDQLAGLLPNSLGNLHDHFDKFIPLTGSSEAREA